MGIDVLGPLRVDGQRALSPRERTVVAALAVRRGESVAPDEIADAVWGDAPPRSWPKQVQICVWSLRKRLGAAVIETVDGGYRLSAAASDLDVARFEELLSRGRAFSATGDMDRAASALTQALELWRGHPFDDVDRWMPGRHESARLEELRLTAQEELIDARLVVGEHHDVVAAAEARAAEQPLRERRWASLALAQYRCGRQADALRSLRRAREVLVDQLGVTPGPRLVELERSILAQHAGLMVTGRDVVSTRCPYRGLAPYDVADGDAFFGRTGEVAACLDRLAGVRMLVVSGASGSGKSSLVRAGIVPALRRRHLDVVLMVPGTDPDAAMTSALASSSGNPVLVVDQLEELFAPGDDRGVGAFCERLAAHAVGCSPVIVTIRSDHLGDLAGEPRLARLVEAGLFLVGPLGPDALREVIEAPAAQAGLRLEAGLTDLLVREVVGEQGGLPLLSHALAETWARRDGRVLTIDGYRATGEIRGAVARSAEQLYQRLTPQQQALLRQLLLRLVAISTDLGPISTHLIRDPLAADERDRVLDLLVSARLVTADDASVGLAHEALTRAWPRLRTWIEEDAEGQRILRHLAGAGGTWDAMGRPDSELYRGARLQSALEWQRTTHPELSDVESEFLSAAEALAEAERAEVDRRARLQARQNRRLRGAVLAVAALLVVAVAAGAVATRQRDHALTGERDAALSALVSNAASLRSNRRDLAALLAIEAHRLAPGAATEAALLGTFTSAPGADRTMLTDIPTSLQEPHADAAFMADGTLAVVDPFGAVHLIDRDDGSDTVLAALSDVAGHPSLALAADGRHAAVAWRAVDDVTSLVTAWDLDTRTRQFEATAVELPVVDLALDPDGSILAAAADDGRLQLLDGNDGHVRARVAAGAPTSEPGPPTAPIAFAADHRLAVGSSSGALRILDGDSGAEIDHIDTPAGTANEFVAFTADGGSLVTAGVAGAQRYDVTTGVATWFDTSQISDCNAVALAEVAGLLLCGESSGRVVAVDLATGANLGRRFDPQHGDVCGLAMSDRGDRLATITSCRTGTATIVQWRLDGGGPISTVIAETHGDRWVEQFGFRGTNALVAAWQDPTDQYPTIRAVDVDANGGTDQIAELPGVVGVWPTDDPSIAVVFYPDETLGRYDTARQQPAGPKVHPGMLMGNAVSTDGHTATMIVDDYKRVRTIDLLTGAVVAPSFDVTAGTVGQVILDGDRLYTQAEDWAGEAAGFRVERRDRSTGAVITASAPGYIRTAARGGVVIAATLDGRVVELDPESLEPTGAPFPSVHGSVGVGSVSIDAAGRRLMVRADDDSLRFYDIPSRTQLGDPIDIASDIEFPTATLRADGLAAAAATGNGIVVWDLDPEHWEAAACRLAGRNLTTAEWEQYIGDLAPYRSTCPQHLD